MIGPAQFVNGIWIGIVLIALGLLPELFENLTDSLRKITGVPVPIPSRWRAQIQQVPLKRQPWLVMLGAVIIAATFLLYFAI
jgi:hypothetical protein